MSLPAGLVTALADRYRLERELGQGGMATVYLAEDLRHDRKVAVKVLRPDISAILGGERFLAEIKTTANLQHPHILPLHDSGEAAGMVYYVMPYVQGESLRDRLVRDHQLPVDEAVRIGREIADALQYAHEHGIVHRDIKPENILLHGGHAMVADFGIALAASRSDGASRMTETGMSLGTPHYMAPEQAMGEREITPRCDVYALGCVVYEMLAGEPPFTGPTAQAIIARVMTEEPRSLAIQRRSVPEYVEAAVNHALEKLPADRFPTARAFGEALAGPVTAAAGWSRSSTAARRVDRSSPLRRGLPYLLTALGLLAGVLIGSRLGEKAAPPRPLRLVVPIPAETPPVAIRLSPDGSTLAYISGQGGRLAIYVRRLDELAARRLEGTEDAFTLSFSPDGEYIAFMVGTTARRVPVRGGAAVGIPVQTAAGTVTAALEYAGPDRFVMSTQDGLVRVGPNGELELFARQDSAAGESALSLNQVLPDGWVLGRSWTEPPYGPILAFDPASGKRIVIAPVVASWAGYADGVLAWTLADGALYAAPFDLENKRLAGPARPVGATVLSVLGFVPPVTIAPGGLAYVPTRPRSLVKISRGGEVTPLLESDRTYHDPRVSPDGRRIALDLTDQERDIWLLDIADATLTRFGFDSVAHDAEWMPDGRGLLFAAIRGGKIGVFRRRFDSGGAADSVFVGPQQVTIHTLTADGRTGIGVSLDAGSFDIVSMDLAGNDPTPRPILQSRYSEGWPALSPDGRWLAYQSDESGRQEVYIRSWPGLGNKVQVSQGGSEPAWSPDGRELFYRSVGEGQEWLVAATLEWGDVPRVRSRARLFGVDNIEFATPHRNYDVFPDGRSFVMVRQGQPDQRAEVVYLQNLHQLAGTR